MPPMGTNMATLNGEVSQEQLEYYELRAKGGTGLITIENICIDFPFASNGTTQLRIDNDQYIPRLFKLTETLHKHGACVSPRFYVSTSKSIIKALINMHSFEIQLSPIG